MADSSTRTEDIKNGLEQQDINKKKERIKQFGKMWEGEGGVQRGVEVDNWDCSTLGKTRV